MAITGYINQLNTRYKSGISREHAYRTDLEILIRALVSGVDITNEPANVTDCGNPDYVITRKKIPVGYIEAKDIGKDLKAAVYKEQFNRYRKALDNLIITDYLWFQFYRHGQLIHEIRIGEPDGKKINPLPENFEQFERLIKDFCSFVGQTIRSSKKLAEMMAAKARLLENILERAVTSDEETQENTSLKGQYESFKHILIHDLTPKAFADIYAQTLAYGMFAARLHDPSLQDFSRQEAAELIPKTNPFLRKLFQYVAGYDIDERIKTTVDNLADVFRATDVKALLQNFGKSTQTQDPIIHFYETFLSEYDPKLRKSRGVWYTPEPVVNFIVRAVDDILKTEFGLPDGIADISKTKIKRRTQTKDNRTESGYKEIEQEVHKVQILDPATGTGTFLAEVVKHIYNSRFQHMQGAWSGYVEEHLIPRLNGFELLMASYSMAHLKLDMLLRDTGFKVSPPAKEGWTPAGGRGGQRFNIYLTNSLEEHHPDTGTLFAGWLSSEANEANHIKRDTPVMVVMGNPPYSVSSTNKSKWIEKLMQDYKKDLNERNIQPLSDDYIKFIRYGHYFIEKNGEGILAYISNNSFIDGLIHRQMRKSLLETFDKIYILDLHGNSKKKEINPAGGKDENVFDIMQGVSINIFVKSKVKSSDVFQYDIFGTRQQKNNFLLNNSIDSIAWNKPELKEPNLFFTMKDFTFSEFYEKGFKLDELFILKSSGIKTQRDDASIKFSKNECNEILDDFLNLTNQELKNKYGFKNVRDWTTENAKNDLYRNPIIADLITYRTFDKRYINYTGKTKGIMGYPRYEVMKHLILNKNYSLITSKQLSTFNFQHIFISDLLSDINSISLQTKEISYVFPLYLYPEKNNQQTLSATNSRTPNLNAKIVNQIAKKLGLTFVPEKEPVGQVCYINNPEVRNDFKTTFAPIDLLDYIYAVLHSPAYREKYKEFLKIDFPRVPYPANSETFWQLVELGGQLRKIHLLESPKVSEFITSYPIDGDNTVTRKMTTKSIGWESTSAEKTIGRVWINDTQYFDGVPRVAWEFYIGGYQPAQKWLKDRKDRTLNYEDIQHYQKIIVALTETHRLMQEVDKVGVESS
jgi:predicted helicase